MALGSPTVKAEIELQGGAKGYFIVPAGTSTGKDEAKTVGVEKALANLNKIHLEVTQRGLKANQLVEIGKLMLEMGKDELGAEATLAYQMPQRGQLPNK
jgi:enolase